MLSLPHDQLIHSITTNTWIYGSDQRSTMMKRLALTFCNTPPGILIRIATSIQNETINPDRSIESRSSLITRQQQQLGRRHCGKGSDEEINVQIASQSTLQYTAHISFERSIPKRFIHPPPTNQWSQVHSSIGRSSRNYRSSIDRWLCIAVSNILLLNINIVHPCTTYYLRVRLIWSSLLFLLSSRIIFIKMFDCSWLGISRRRK